MLNCAVDSGLGGYERNQAVLANAYDDACETMRPFTSFFNAVKKAMDLLPISEKDKTTMLEYALIGFSETSFCEENPEIEIGEHIEGYNQAMGWNN